MSGTSYPLQYRGWGHLQMQHVNSPKLSKEAVAPTLGLQRWPQVHKLTAGLVGGWEVAGIPRRCADRWNSASCEQEACWRRLLRLKLCRDGSLRVCFSQTLDVACVPRRHETPDKDQAWLGGCFSTRKLSRHPMVQACAAYGAPAQATARLYK